jgi:hypothetical protein
MGFSYLKVAHIVENKSVKIYKNTVKVKMS